MLKSTFSHRSTDFGWCPAAAQVFNASVISSCDDSYRAEPFEWRVWGRNWRNPWEFRGKKDGIRTDLCGFFCGLMGFYSVLMGFYSVLMGFYSVLMGFYSVLMGFCSVLMGYYSVLMGCSCIINGTKHGIIMGSHRKIK
jgi:hypothetical protein